MSCVLRVTVDGLAEALSILSFKPYRLDRGTAHFLVSDCDFDNLPGQVHDAADFLRNYEVELANLLQTPGAAGVLDFGVEAVTSEFRFANFPADLVRKAGSLGLALEVSQYPVGESI